MAGGANKEFIEQRERFLNKNVILSPNIQSYMATKAMSAKVPLSRVEMVGVYDFDLRKDPALDIRDHSGKKQDVYILYLLEQRAAHNVGVVTKDTNAIRAFYLPWDNGRSWTVSLSDRADFIFTPTLDGCSIVAESGTNPRVSHLNFQNAAKTRVDPVAIDADIARIYGIGAKPGLRKLEKDNYSDDAEKERGINPTVTVIGFRNRVTNTWDFYYQRQLSNTLPNPSGRGSIVQNILENRLVRIT
jgi:hypothetical protein